MKSKKNEVTDETLSSLKKKKRSVNVSWRIVLAFATILLNVLLTFVLFYVTKFSSLSKDMFVLLNVAAVVVLLVIDVIVFMIVRFGNKALTVIMSVFLCITLLGGSYACYALSRVEKTMNNITSTEYTVSVSTSLVKYDKTSGDPIMDKNDLSNKKVGFAIGTDTAQVGQDYLKESNIDPEYKEYTDYFSLFKGLISEEIDCAVLPGNYITLMNSDESLATYTGDTSVLETFTKDVTATNNPGSNKDLTKEPFTVLVTGENEGLADTIILVSVNPISMDITMTSIARDSYVPITCYGGGSSKINAAHAVSEACIVDTVSQLTGVTIDYTVEFNFASVIEVVDAVGGVDVLNDTPFYGQCWNIETDSLEVLPIPYSEDGSKVHMNGQQALGFVRERHAFPDGDFARQRHQQAVIQDLISKVLSTKDPNTYLNILEAAGANIKTNFTTEQMIQFISYAMRKADRYYDPSNLAGVFNITSNRITGYSSTMWDSSLGMNLYTYLLYDGAISDAYKTIEDNLNISSSPSVPGNVSWSASEAYKRPQTIADYYDEATQSPSTGSSNYGYEEQYVPSEPEVNVPSEPVPAPEASVPEEPVVPEQTPVEPQQSTDPGQTNPNEQEDPAPQPPVPEQNVPPEVPQPPAVPEGQGNEQR